MTRAAQPDAETGKAVTLAPGLRRILAPNPSPMTGRGTNTYLLGTRGIAVIDPGPDDRRHLHGILAALAPDQHVSHILVTHAHLDHSPLARPLGEETGAPVMAYGNAEAGRSAVMRQLAHTGEIAGGEGVDTAFLPDRVLADGARIDGDGWHLTALWTPGHFGNHLCLEHGDAIFSGDLVMGWASSLISPPDGDLGDYIASCRRLRGRGARILHPGHGAPVTAPSERIDALIAHRKAREAEILAALAHEPGSARMLAARIYSDTPAALLPAAERNVFAHLLDLAGRDRAAPQGSLRTETVFTRR